MGYRPDRQPHDRVGAKLSRRPVLSWMLRVLWAARLALLLLFTAYFVSVQTNAVAYLAGRNDPIAGGSAPPVPLHSDVAAAADIIAGLAFEALAALIVFIMVALFHTRRWHVMGRTRHGHCRRIMPPSCRRRQRRRIRQGWNIVPLPVLTSLYSREYPQLRSM